MTQKCNKCSKPSDLRCSACKKQWYCSKACQGADYHAHKESCGVGVVISGVSINTQLQNPFGLTTQPNHSLDIQPSIRIQCYPAETRSLFARIPRDRKLLRGLITWLCHRVRGRVPTSITIITDPDTYTGQDLATDLVNNCVWPRTIRLSLNGKAMDVRCSTDISTILIETSRDLFKKGCKATSTEAKKELWESATLILAEWETHLNPQCRLAWLDQSCNVFKHQIELLYVQGHKSEASAYARIIVDLGMSDTILDQPTLWDCAHILRDNREYPLAMLVAMRLLSMTHDERVIKLVQDVRTRVSEMGIWAAAEASKAWTQRTNRRQAIDDIPLYIETAEDALCAICRDALRGSATQLGCSHTFHTVCAQAWLITKPTCPECGFLVFDS